MNSLLLFVYILLVPFLFFTFRKTVVYEKKKISKLRSCLMFVLRFTSFWSYPVVCEGLEVSLAAGSCGCEISFKPSFLWANKHTATMSVQVWRASVCYSVVWRACAVFERTCLNRTIALWPSGGQDIITEGDVSVEAEHLDGKQRAFSGGPNLIRDYRITQGGLPQTE